MLAPERRSRVDLLAAVAIALVVLLTAGVIWLRSDARGTTSVTATTPATPAESALSVPESLSEAWRAGSGATTAPITVGGAVVTADEGTVTGHDPVTGDEIWHYRRDMPLCGAIGAWNTAVAVYRDRSGCGQVTQLDGSTGSRQAQRNSDADDVVELSEDGTYATSRGSTRMELWRSDLVRTLEYGRVDAPVNPKAQPRTDCALRSSGSSSSRLAVVERCSDEPADRLSVQNPAPKDNTEPEEYGTTVLPDAGDGVRVIAVSGDRTALYLPPAPGGQARIGVYDGSGVLEDQYPVSGDVSPAATATKAGSLFLWWTGSRVTALRTTDFTPAWSFDGALGPGTVMAGEILVPVADGVAVLDQTSGAQTRLIPVHRDIAAPDAGAPVVPSVLGTMVLEQRGDELVALH
ncbi:hypothetical protein [Rhodococcus kronopolitis]|uniref:Pyrroloquinoline-quinone binding quinoprotein n=1 Tax=Rhodococcus kronopolitis TaxID=1460226 RepID=A0ABV9FL19_9NOCA